MGEPGTSSLSAVWAWLGRVPFAPVARLQERLRDAVIAGQGPETLLVCEHDPVITLGRAADPRNVLVDEAELNRLGVALVRASRGGDVTYHGPGQLVAYPLLRLRRGVVGHVESMATAVIALLAEFGIVGRWRRDVPGVWVGDEKICAFGVHVRHRVASHGLALNVSTDLSSFDAIVPCGLRDTGVTSMKRLLGATPALHELAPRLVRACEGAFGLSFGDAATPLRVDNHAAESIQ